MPYTPPQPAPYLTFHFEKEREQPSTCFEEECWRPLEDHYSTRDKAVTAHYDFWKFLEEE